MKDEHEKFDDAHWRALAESLKGEDEPPRKAEVIRAQFGRNAALPAETPQTTEPPAPSTRDAEIGTAGTPSENMSRPELVAYLRSALTKLEQGPASKPPRANSNQSAESRPSMRPSADRVDTRRSPEELAAPNSENLEEGSATVAAAGLEEPTQSASRLVHREKFPTPAEKSREEPDHEPAGMTLAGRLESSSPGTGPAQADKAHYRKRPLQFSQEVPDFLRSKDIRWPSNSNMRRSVEPAVAGARLKALYPGRVDDLREAPPPWVKQDQPPPPRRRRWVPAAATAAVVLLLSTGAAWFFSQPVALDGNTAAIQSWLNRAGNAGRAGVRESGRIIRMLVPFGPHEPPIQSIVLLPSGGEEPSVQIPRQDGIGLASTDKALPLLSAPTERLVSPAKPAGRTDDTGESLSLTIAPTFSPTSEEQRGTEPVEGAAPLADQTSDLVASEKEDALPPADAPTETAENFFAGRSEQASPPSTTQKGLAVLPGIAVSAPPEATPPQAPAANQIAAPLAETSVPPIADEAQPSIGKPIVGNRDDQAPTADADGVPAPPSENWRVQLASLAKGTSPQAEWQRLQQIHPALLADRLLHVERAELDRGIFFRIQAGDFETDSAAQDLCNRLKERGQDCLVVR